MSPPPSERSREKKKERKKKGKGKEINGEDKGKMKNPRIILEIQEYFISVASFQQEF